VGYIISTTSQLKVHMSKVAVDKGHRRQGIARRLIQATSCFHCSGDPA
jgi:ribosomal protein S18 acetylase RimI-like enzyme